MTKPSTRRCDDYLVDAIYRVDGNCVVTSPDGAGLATARLADISGYFGRAVQSLVIEKG